MNVLPSEEADEESEPERWLSVPPVELSRAEPTRGSLFWF